MGACPCEENGDGGGGVFLFGVFDGHGRMGHEAANYQTVTSSSLRTEDALL